MIKLSSLSDLWTFLAGLNEQAREQIISGLDLDNLIQGATDRNFFTLLKDAPQEIQERYEEEAERRLARLFYGKPRR